MKMMMKVLICLALVLALAYSYPSEDLIERDVAESFLDDEATLSLVRRSLKYSGSEQRNEAKEKYEEKCERSYASKKMGKPRWCPELTLWDEWKVATKNDKPKTKIFG